MRFEPTPLPGAVVVEPTVFGDTRGHFFESWNAKRFADAGIEVGFVQDNQSRSARNVLRGLHYQLPRPQGKLVRCIGGSIFDVVVDIRRSSPTFGQWYGVDLTAENRRMLWVPAGFAHGFVVTSETAEILYKVTDFWAPDCEHTIAWDDPTLAIRWPLAGAPVLSGKDRAGLAFGSAPTFD